MIRSTRLGRRHSRTSPPGGRRSLLNTLAAATGIALLLLAGCSHWTYDFWFAAAPGKLSSDLQLKFEEHHLRDAVEADDFPAAGEDGL